MTRPVRARSPLVRLGINLIQAVGGLERRFENVPAEEHSDWLPEADGKSRQRDERNIPLAHLELL